MKIAFCTLGCKLNFAESSTIGKTLFAAGHERAKKGEQADVVIVNTCSVTDAADHKGRQAIHRLKREHPKAKIVVTGCYAELKPQEIAAMSEVDVVVSANQKQRVAQWVEKWAQEKQNEAAIGQEYDAMSCSCDDKQAAVEGQEREAMACSCDDKQAAAFFAACSWDDRTRCFLKVQDGCNYFCTYCTIPLARGRSRNMPIADIVAQAEQAIRDGAKEIVLTGVNIGDFGRTTSERFIDLLSALDTIPTEQDYRIRISSCEPNLLSEEVIDLVAESKHFAPHFHIPLQSGSNEVLKIMHRRYDRELFASRVAYIRKKIPHAFIGVDCMVGVRGETEQCWEDYLAFVKGLELSQLHVFTYSERANTRMLEMELYVVPKKERERRSKILHEVSEEKLRAFYRLHEGREATVLWESKKEGDKMAGFTENYIKVYAPYDKAKVNTYEKICVHTDL